MDLVVWLRSIGLEQYEAAFRENGSDNYVALAATADGTTAGAYFSQGSSAGAHRQHGEVRWCGDGEVV